MGWVGGGVGWVGVGWGGGETSLNTLHTNAAQEEDGRRLHSASAETLFCCGSLARPTDVT